MTNLVHGNKETNLHVSQALNAAVWRHFLAAFNNGVTLP